MVRSEYVIVYRNENKMPEEIFLKVKRNDRQIASRAYPLTDQMRSLKMLITSKQKLNRFKKQRHKNLHCITVYIKTSDFGIFKGSYFTLEMNAFSYDQSNTCNYE